MRLRPAFEGCEVVFLTTEAGYAADVAPARLIVVPDANRWNKVAVARMFLAVLWAVVRVRPDVVVTTGAAPGYAAIRFAKLLGARTMWIDSIANSEELSMSGRMAGKHAHEWLTQWEHLGVSGEARTRRGDQERAPRFEGAVL
ncbi:MAG: hypothetical protein JJU33_14015 [Phycisphaerales bacterium]|nr:hypothetical protein [Phycisphaerales bacterium]